MSAKQPARRPRAQASSTDDSAATPRPKASRRAISKAAPAQVAAVTAAPPFDPAASLLPGIAPIGRIPVQDVRPLVDGGTRPAKAVVHETFTITATVFREGHDAVNATAVLTDPEGVDHPVPMTCVNPGLNTWVAEVTPTSAGWWTYRVEGWSDPYGTWEHDGTIKVDAGVDVELMLEEGARVIERAIGAWPVTVEPVPAVLPDAVLALRDTARPAQARLRAGTADGVRAALARHPLREMVSPSPRYRLLVERELALFGACLLYTSPSPRDGLLSRMPSSA